MWVVSEKDLNVIQFNTFPACFGDKEVQALIPTRSGQHSFIEIDHEIFFKVILSLLLIQKGQLSVTDNRMCTGSGLPLRGLSLPGKSMVR